MTQRSIRWGIPLLWVAVIAACATPQAVAPPPAGGPALPAPLPAGTSLPPRAEDLPSYPLVRDDPGVAGATAGLAAASAANRPAALMSRARAAFAAALKLRSDAGAAMGFSGWSLARERFLAYCELALRDLEELLAFSPRSPEAAEAMFTVGQINDYPNLNQFDEALAAYRLTVDRYPSTSWAARARERAALIEGIMDTQGVHQGGAPPSTTTPR